MGISPGLLHACTTAQMRNISLHTHTHTHICVCARALCVESSKANLSSASSAVLNVGRVAVLEKSRL
jgi:hypothetical protein